MGLSTNAPVASGPILPDSSWWMQRDFTRKYHAQVFQQELAFRARLSHLYASSSRQELLHQEFGKNPNQIFQQENGKNLQQNSSKSPDSVLLKQPEWSSFCEIDSKTEVLEKCNFVDKEVLMSKEPKEGSDNGREEKSEQQNTQTDQQQQERDISNDLEDQEKSMKNDSIPFNECQRLSNSNQLTTDECLTCNKVFKCQKDYESHLAGRKHAKQFSQRLVRFKDLSKVKDGDKKCENSGESRLQKYDKNLQQNSSKSPDSVLPKQSGWSSFCEVDSKTEVLEKCNFIDKEVLMSKELKEGSDNGREEKSEQHQQERDISDDLEKQEKSMKNGSIPFSECQRSLYSNQLTTDECLTCNKVFRSQKDFESHLAGRKHAKQLPQRLIRFEDLSEFKDGSTKCENAGDSRLQEYGKKLQQNSFKFPDLVLPKQPGWSSFCEADSKKEVLEKCNFIDKEVLTAKELKEGSDNGSEEKSEQQKTQTAQQQQERDISDDLEKQEKSMENDSIPFSECQRSSNSNQLTTDECLTCNKVFKSQKDFESHRAGRKHAKQLLQRLTCFEDLSEFKDGSKKCENAGDSRFLIKNDVEKSLEKELIEKVKYDGDLAAKDGKVCLKENRELNEQQQVMVGAQQVMVGAMPYKLCKKSSNLSELIIINCKLSYIKGDEQRSSENKPVWKAQDDKYLGAKINEIYMKENTELIDQHQMKEGNLKQQKVQIEQQMTEGNSKQQNPQMEQKMVEGGTPSLKSNQLRSKECIACNKLFNSQAGFESHLAGRKHAKKLLKRITCVKVLSEVKDDSKKCANASEKVLISIDSGLVVKDNMEKGFEKELVEKVKYNGDLFAKEEKFSMKENAELNELQQIMVGVMPLKLCKRSSNLSELSIKNCKISYIKGDEQRSFENKPAWKVNDDKDLGATINQADIEENAELIDQHQMQEGNSKLQLVQIEQQMTEGRSKKQDPQMEQQMMEEGTPSLKSNQSRTEECVACNTVINSQDDLKSHLAGRKHAKKSLQRITRAKALSEVRDDSKHCENAGEKMLISIDSGLVVKDNVEKRMEKDLVEKFKYNGDLVAKEDKVGMKENAELNEQQQIMVGAMTLKPCKWSSNLSELSIKNCKISYVKCDEQKCSENKHVWKAKGGKDLGAKINEVDMKEKTELIDQHQMKEGNSKEQTVQIEQQMAEGDSEQQMMEKGTPSLKSNQSRTEEFLTCNKVFKSQKVFESHLAGTKHAKELLQRITCVKALSEVKDDSKKCENAGEKLLISIDSGLMVKDNMEKRLEKELDEKVKYNGDLVAKEDNVGMKGTVVLNEKQRMMVGAMPSKVCKKSSNLSDLSIKNCNISYVKGDEQKSAENKPIWKPKDDKYLGAKINKIDMKKNVELIDQDQMKEGISKQQKVQIEQQMIEGNSKQQNPQMEQQMMQGGTSSLKSDQLRTQECVACNEVFNSQDDFESCLAGRKHAKKLLQTIKCVKALSEVKDDSMKCENAGKKILISTDSGLPVKDNIEKRLEKELVEKVKYDGVLVAKEEKVGVKENAELNEQQQIMKSYENKPVWKAKDDKDSGTKINKVDMKENTELIDQHQMKEGNSKQQKVQIEQEMTEGNPKQQNPQMEQQMMQGGTPSLKSNQLRTEECVTCNKVFNSQDDFETHLAGRKHAKQLLQTMKCVEALSEVKDDSKKCENAGEKILISTDTGLLLMDNLEKRLEKELVEKVKYDGVLVAKEKVGVKENGELNEQQQIMVSSLPSKLCKRSSDLNKLSIKNCKISYVKCDEQKSYENKPVWKAKDGKDLGAKINEVDMKENTELIDQHQMKEGSLMQQKIQIEQQLIEGNSKQRKPQMEQQMMEEGTTFKEYGGSLNSNPLKFKECVTCNIALKIQGVFEAHLSGSKHAKQLKEMKTKVVWKVADDSDFNTKSNKVGMKETDEHELEQMNTRGVSSKVCKMLSNARQLNIEECSISKENDDVNRSDKNKLVWKVKDDMNLDAKRNRVDMKESAELNEQCLIREEDSEQQIFQSEQKMKEGKLKQQKLQMEQQMKEGISKTQKLQMKQQIMENGLKNKHHEGLTSEQSEVNGYAICNTVLNFCGDSEAEFARRKHAKQLKKMENKTVWKVTDKRHLSSKSDKFLMNETTELSEKQHMKGMKETAELSEKQHMECMKETAEPSEKQPMKEDCMPSKICKNSSNASQLSINEFKMPITKDKVDKGAINQSVRKANEQQWMRKTNTKQQKLQREQQLQEKHN